uniref:Zinc finger LSD1-type domain-containing protein n=1 Tax=Oryza glumipatula TaxID=40148 RepID=A0A0E0AJI5_9ORYZ
MAVLYVTFLREVDVGRGLVALCAHWLKLIVALLSTSLIYQEVLSSLAFTGFFRTEIFLAFSSASLESFCRERKGDFSCLTVAGICEASTSDAIGSGSWHSNAGSPCPISNSWAQSQLVCSGCRNLLMYPAGATSICCAVCGTVTAVPAPEQKSSCNVHENKERLKGNTNGFRAPQRCARRVDGACTQVPNPLTLAMSLEKYTLKLLCK